MAYNYLIGAVKDFTIRELKDSFSRHPKYNKVANNISTAFPLKEKPQTGIKIINASGTLLKLQADNFMDTLVSHLWVGKFKEKPGQFIEWIREDSLNITKKAFEDITGQADGKTAFFKVSNKPIINLKTGEVENNLTDITVFVNFARVQPIMVDGRQGTFTLSMVPRIGSKIEVLYFYRDMDPPGFYVLEMDTDHSFVIGEFFKEDKDILTSSYDGVRLAFPLKQKGIVPGSTFITFDRRVRLEETEEYTVDNVNGIIIFLNNQVVPPGATIEAEYKFTGGQRGPFPIESWTSNNTALKGVVLAFGDKLAKGDKVFVGITDRRLEIGSEQGGKWEITLDLQVYARDDIQRDEIADLVPSMFWYSKKSRFDAIGVALTDVSMGGEGTEVYDPTQGTLYFTHSISISFLTEWTLFREYTLEITAIDLLIRDGDDLPLNVQDTLRGIQAVVPARFGVRPIDQFVNFERLSQPNIEKKLDHEQDILDSTKVD